MKKSKVLALAGITLLSAGFLAACSGSNSNSAGAGKTYSYVYQTDPENLDYLTSSKAAIHDITTNVIDGLLENDRYGNFVPSMAEDWTVSKDGLTYTYKLRKGVNWYTSEGEEYAEVKAQDFVTGLKYAADKESQALYLIQDSIKGLDDYIKGKNKDFASVGIKAIDDYTVEYTLNQPESYWNSKTTMGILYPVNEEFLKSQGDKFASATDPTTLLYNGPFILKSITAKSAIEFAKNENYWDKDNVHIDNVKLSYYDGSDQDSLAKNFADGVYSIARVFPNSASYDAVKKQFSENITYAPQGSASYIVGMNIDRQSYDHTSKTTDAQKTSTKKALLNKDFRQALAFAFDRESYSAQINGKDGASKVLRNMFVPPTFVAAGDKSFGDIVEADLQSKGDEWKDVDLSDGQNGLYNPEKAKAEFAKAKEALQAEGVEFPIRLDAPTIKTDKARVARLQSLKQSIEESLGTDNVVIDIQQLSEEDVLNMTYYAPTAAQAGWDISDIVGWIPDFQDPSTYLNIIKPSSGDNTKLFLGFDAGKDNAAAKTVGLTEFEELVNAADNEKLDLNKRYEKYAAAQAWLTDSALIIPSMSNGATAMLRKTVPFSTAFAWSGNKGADPNVVYKYVELQDEPATTAEYQKALEKWQKEKAESNAKYQEDLAKHVK
ncbi:peptide ABC transporter substrate-binding protein [Streptococcus himalayensis]|uniref:Peptide ABC transporter ATP-binding protein n=1 Tax=Streptococcus himalayensis TaxID=1888195 RepID=A0A917A6S5_9STRE|nr:peptide ABC transporter substrate-binding protein [Streptococcus himalayensis]GGE31077.1 peptide ABC transporter ATP-binding protein [Streptococcus himalayensis]